MDRQGGSSRQAVRYINVGHFYCKSESSFTCSILATTIALRPIFSQLVKPVRQVANRAAHLEPRSRSKLALPPAF
eukprot:SAG22_NODE_843_length_6889_cov_61.521649_7_plen_75_part_00